VGRELFDRVAALALDYEDSLLSVLTVEERDVFVQTLSKLEERLANGVDE